MSDDENENCVYGTALPELPNDVIPTKKPITVADQIAVDANGKRRFHGAFTGGFSAGYWNTVGSQEGWTPKEFKSSRSEKASRVTQNPKDFMDDEDCGEFGINPQRIQTTDDFTHTSAVKSNRREPHASSTAAGGEAIAGNPVLNMFLMPAKEKACVALLKRMGWRENKDGRFSKSRRKGSQNERPAAKVYACSMGPMEAFAATASIDANDDSENDDDKNRTEASDSDDSIVSVTFNLDDFDEMTHAPKTNRFGLGYRGLLSDQSASTSTTTEMALQHVNLFGPAFEVVDRKHQKKLSIRGQAFGVGAFEEDDDDIYALDDMSRYNFEQTKRTNADRRAIEAAPVKYAQTIDGFMPADKGAAELAKTIYTVQMPRDFRPRNWLQRKTRFEPAIDVPPQSETLAKQKGMGRHMLTPDQRGQLLGDKTATARIPPPGAAPIVPAANIAAQKMLESFDNRFVSVSADVPPANARTGLQPKPTTIGESVQQKLDALFTKNFVAAGAVAGTDEAQSVATIASDESHQQTTTAPPPKPDYIVKMKRDVVTWQPCPLLYQLMNIEDPSSRSGTGKNGSMAAPFSLLKHVYPERRSRASEKEFTAAKAASEQEVLVNAYVPRSAKITEPKRVAPSIFESTASSTAVTATVSATAIQKTSAEAIVHRPNVTPKTDLEQSISKSASVHPAEKKDIFKAIFESSDEEAEEDTEEEQRMVVTKAADASAQLMANLLATKNILRNTSPPRGIFSSLSKLQQPISADRSQTNADRTPAVQAELPPDAYGPPLPKLADIQMRSAATVAAVSNNADHSRKRSHHHSTDSSESDSESEWIVATPSASTSTKSSRDDRSKSRSKQKKHKEHKHKRSKSKKCKKQKKHKK